MAITDYSKVLIINIELWSHEAQLKVVPCELRTTSLVNKSSNNKQFTTASTRKDVEAVALYL